MMLVVVRRRRDFPRLGGNCRKLGSGCFFLPNLTPFIWLHSYAGGLNLSGMIGGLLEGGCRFYQTAAAIAPSVSMNMLLNLVVDCNLYWLF